MDKINVGDLVVVTCDRGARAYKGLIGQVGKVTKVNVINEFDKYTLIETSLLKNVEMCAYRFKKVNSDSLLRKEEGMRKFKEGDKVRRVDGSTFSNGKLIGTVFYKPYGPELWIKETGTWITNESDLELVTTGVEEGRKELLSALKLMVEHSINRISERFTLTGVDGVFTKEELVDRLLPRKTPKQIEIEKIESEMRRLADSLDKLNQE